MHYLFLDTETGGLQPSQTSLLQLALVVAEWKVSESNEDEFVIIDKLNLKLCPDDRVYHVKSGALEVNGIDLALHNKSALSYSAAYAIVKQFLEQYKCKHMSPVGWNIGFDLGFIYEYLMSKDLWEMYVGYRNIDLCSVVRFLYECGTIPCTGSLVHVAKYFGIDTTSAHDALTDTEICVQVMQKLVTVTKGFINNGAS